MVIVEEANGMLASGVSFLMLCVVVLLQLQTPITSFMPLHLQQSQGIWY